jgi:hypothetical protein
VVNNVKETKLIELIGTFSNNELKDFERFINSPFHVKGLRVNYEKLKRFFGILKQQYPEFENFTKEKAFIILYPGKKYDDTAIRQLMQVLTKLGEEFIVYSSVENDSFTKEIILLNSLSRRKLDKMFVQHSKAAEKILEESPKGPQYHYNKQQLITVVNDFCIFRHKLRETYDLQQEMDHFFSYFFVQAMQYYKNSVINESMWNVSYNKPFFAEVMNYLGKNPEYIKKHSLIELEYYHLLINLEPNNRNFYKLKELKDSYGMYLTGDTLHSVYASLNGYCIIKISGGDMRFRHEKLLLDIEILEKEVFSKIDYIPMNDYFSCTINSIFLKDYKWTERFIEAYLPGLDPQHSEFAANYVFAELEFSKGDHSKALEHLSRINVEYSRDKINMKFLTMKIYYETGNIEGILYMADSLKHSVKNDTLLTQPQKKFCFKIIKLFYSMALLKTEPDKKKLTVLLNELNTGKYFRHKEWFLDKACELKAF